MFFCFFFVFVSINFFLLGWAGWTDDNERTIAHSVMTVSCRVAAAAVRRRSPSSLCRSVCVICLFLFRVFFFWWSPAGPAGNGGGGNGGAPSAVGAGEMLLLSVGGGGGDA